MNKIRVATCFSYLCRNGPRSSSILVAMLNRQGCYIAVDVSETGPSWSLS